LRLDLRETLLLFLLLSYPFLLCLLLLTDLLFNGHPRLKIFFFLLKLLHVTTHLIRFVFLLLGWLLRGAQLLVLCLLLLSELLGAVDFLMRDLKEAE